MKYNTVHIRKRLITEYGKYKFEVSVTVNKLNREETETMPCSMGFFHFPETMSAKEALSFLKTRMIEDRTDTVRQLLVEITDLCKLELK